MTGKPLIDKILITLGLLSTISVLSLFIYTDIIFVKELPDDATEFEALKKEGAKINVTKGFSLKKVTINLRSSRKLRFLSSKMVLLPFKEKQIQKIEDNQALIRDIIIDTGSQMSAKELASITGKIIFEEKIKEVVNQNFKTPLLKEVFFSDFVIQ